MTQSSRSIFRQYLLWQERNSHFSGESFILPTIKEGRYVCSKSVSYINFYKLFKAAIVGVHCDPDMYGLHSPKVEAVVARANLGITKASGGFVPDSEMAGCYSQKSLKRNGDLDDILSMGFMTLVHCAIVYDDVYKQYIVLALLSRCASMDAWSLPLLRLPAFHAVHPQLFHY